MPTEFVAQNGLEIHESTPIGVSGCPKHVKTKKKKTTTKKQEGRAIKITSPRKEVKHDVQKYPTR